MGAPRGDWTAVIFIVRPLVYEGHGCGIGYLVDAESEEEACREAGQRWGLIASCELDELEES